MSNASHSPCLALKSSRQSRDGDRKTSGVGCLASAVPTLHRMACRRLAKGTHVWTCPHIGSVLSPSRYNGPSRRAIDHFVPVAQEPCSKIYASFFISAAVCPGLACLVVVVSCGLAAQQPLLISILVCSCNCNGNLALQVEH